jgi:DNA/RNA endonuclease YhcR with UshA esterase domain
MMDDRVVIRLCLIGSLVSLAAVYFLGLNLEPPSLKIGEITGSLAGRTVNVTGYASDVFFHRNGHIFFNLQEGEAKVRVVIWESVVEQLRYSGADISSLKNGDLIQIVGTVEMYQGEPELLPVRAQVRLV